MEDPIDAVEIRLDRITLGDVSFDDGQAAARGMRGEVLASSDREIVESDDVVSIRDEAVDQMTSDETGAAGDHASHGDHP